MMASKGSGGGGGDIDIHWICQIDQDLKRALSDLEKLRLAQTELKKDVAFKLENMDSLSLIANMNSGKGSSNGNCFF